jgi:uncharacterized protein
MNRRDALSWIALPFSTVLALGLTRGQLDGLDAARPRTDPRPHGNDHHIHSGALMDVYYLELVTSDVDATCALYSEMYSMTFSDADPSLGGARTTRLANGTMLGVRAPMNESERPVTRPYIVVDDIEVAVAAAERAGAEITVPPMPIQGHGTCAIIYQSGIESGLWQL